MSKSNITYNNITLSLRQELIMNKLQNIDLPETTSTNVTEPRKRKYLELIKKTGNRKTAAAQLGLSYNTIKNIATKDPYFAEMMEIAEAQHLATLEELAFDRAKGIEKDVWFQGVVVGKETVHSDKMLELLLKAQDKDKYSPKQETNTLVIGDDKGVAVALGKFLGVDLDSKANEDEPEEVIIDGEYNEVDK